MADWYVRVEADQALGPISEELLLRGIRSGRVPIEAEVCREGGSTWLQLEFVDEFQDAVGSDDALTRVASSPFDAGGAAQHDYEDIPDHDVFTHIEKSLSSRPPPPPDDGEDDWNDDEVTRVASLHRDDADEVPTGAFPPPRPSTQPFAARAPVKTTQPLAAAKPSTELLPKSAEVPSAPRAAAVAPARVAPKAYEPEEDERTVVVTDPDMSLPGHAALSADVPQPVGATPPAVHPQASTAAAPGAQQLQRPTPAAIPLPPSYQFQPPPPRRSSNVLLILLVVFLAGALAIVITLLVVR